MDVALINNLIDIGLICFAGAISCFSLAFFWFGEEQSHSVLSDCFFTIVFLSVAMLILAYRAEIGKDVISVFVVFCIVTALKLINKTLTRCFHYFFSIKEKKNAFKKRRARILRFKILHITPLKSSKHIKKY